MIGIGVDSVEVERFRKLLERQPRVRERLFSEAELADCSGLADPAQRLASRFAAKEAVMKALGVGLGAFGFHDVAVARVTRQIDRIGEYAQVIRKIRSNCRVRVLAGVAN